MFDCCGWVGYCIAAYIIYKIIDKIVRYPFIMRPVSRHVMVTGCDTGFIHELVKLLDRRGVTVYAGCLTERGETILKKQCSLRIIPVRMNVADPESVKAAYEFVKSKIPPETGLWALLNNAGIAGRVGPIELLEKKDYDHVFSVNLHGLIDVTRRFLPLIKKAKGRVINTASVVGRYSVAGSTPYAISKFGVEAFSDGLRRQLRGYGCECITIEPGFHKTHITSKEYLTQMYKDTWENATPEAKEEFGEEFFEKSMDIMVHKFIDKICSDRIQDVVDAYEHAIMAMFPRTRYTVGFDANFFWIPLTWLPDWIGDVLMDLLSRDKPIPAALKKNQ